MSLPTSCHNPSRIAVTENLVPLYTAPSGPTFNPEIEARFIK